MKPESTKIVEAIHANKGNLTRAAKQIGVTRKTIYEWLKADDTLRAELAHAREILCDMAEDVLVEQLENGNLKAAVFVLQHFGRRTDLLEKPGDFDDMVDLEALDATVPYCPEEL